MTETRRYGPRNPGHDWPEDFAHENGQYTNRCHRCEKTFVGHKRRFVCKACFNRPPATITPIDLSLISPPAWPWPVSLTDADLEDFRQTFSPYVTLLHVCRQGVDLVYTARFPFASGDFDLKGAWGAHGHRWLDARATD